MPKAQETVLEINLNHLTHNFRYLKSKLDTNTRFLAVVKAFAYGSDAQEVAKHLETLGVDYLAVAYVQEGVALRDAGITTPILVLHPQLGNLTTLIERCLEPSLYSSHILKAFISVAEDLHQTHYPVHIKFNSGLNRLGFSENDVKAVTNAIHASNSVKVKSIFSHLAASEDLSETSFTYKQIASFKGIAEQFTDHIGYRPWWHICNTSGVLNYADAHFDMVRCGIGLYGFGNSPEENTHLKPIAALKSVISQIHAIQHGETVGYNRAFKSDGLIKSATIPIGHADGIGRHYGHGKGVVFINGKSAPILGNVCMDMIMVNVTNIDCCEGDEVIIFDEEHSADLLSATVNSISYELITAISQRVKRVYIK